MLRNILLILISIVSTSSFADSFIIKYNEYTSNTVVTEAFAKSDDFSNRLSELGYLNHDSINIIKAKFEKNPSKISFGQKKTLAMKRGGEGVGE